MKRCKLTSINSLFLLIGLLSFTLTCTASDIYKWTDAQGVVHFDEQPAPENNAVKINIDAGVPPNSEADKRQQELIKQQEANKKTQDQLLQQQQDQTAGQKYQKQVEDTCKSYRDNLATLQQTGRRVYTVDAKGQYHYFDDAERQQQIKQLNDNIKTYCTPS